MGKKRRVFQGGVYMIDLSPIIGSEQGGIRPCVCISNNKNNLYATTAQFLPLSSQWKNKLPVHHVLSCCKYNFLNSDSVVLAEQCTTKDVERVVNFMGRIDEDDLHSVQECIREQLDL